MGKTVIYPAAVVDANRILKRAIREMEELDQGLAGLRETIAPELLTSWEGDIRLRRCCTITTETKNTAEELLNVIQQGAEAYVQTESQLMQIFCDDSK